MSMAIGDSGIRGLCNVHQRLLYIVNYLITLGSKRDTEMCALREEGKIVATKWQK